MSETPEIELLLNYLNGTGTSEEDRLVDDWLDESPDHILFLQEFANRSPVLAHNIDKSKVRSDMFKEINKTIFEEEAEADTNWSWKIFIRSAAVILIVSTMTWTINSFGGKIYRAFTFNEAISPPETISQLTLPDGSTVELSAGASLEYPKRFTGEERDVYLKGEAFFMVKRDEERPFKVYTGDLTTTVLGTAFSVSYQEETQKTDIALVEGRVQVEAPAANGINEVVILRPDQWVSYESELRSLQVKDDITGKIRWREGILDFEGETLADVIVKLEAWYGVTISTRDSQALSCKINASFKRQALDQVLSGLRFITGFDYIINGKKITVTGGKCG